MAASENKLTPESPASPADPSPNAGDGGTHFRPQNIPRSFYRDGGNGSQRDLGPRKLEEVAESGSGALWVDMDSTNRHQHAFLAKIFHFHPLAIEDTLSRSSRVKLEEYDGCPELTNPHPARLMHSLMDAEVDGYFPILDQIDEFVDGLEERVFANFEEGALRDIFAMKRLVLSLPGHLSPQHEVFNVFTNRPAPYIPPDVQVYFRDVYDHVLWINDSLETYRELLGSTLDSYLSQVSNRLGKITLGLSVVATMSIPFVVISGMWGMNFDRIPLSGMHNGFWWMLALQLGLGVGLVGALRKWRLM